MRTTITAVIVSQYILYSYKEDNNEKIFVKECIVMWKSSMRHLFEGGSLVYSATLYKG